MEEKESCPEYFSTLLMVVTESSEAFMLAVTPYEKCGLMPVYPGCPFIYGIYLLIQANTVSG